MRIYDTKLIGEAIHYFNKSGNDLNIEEWVANPLNIVLADDLDNVAVFEHMDNGLVNGHYYFKSRGRAALTAGTNFLDEIFSECYNITVIRGFTPLANLGARWLTRQLGFKSHGVIKVGIKPYELFLMHRKDFIHE